MLLIGTKGGWDVAATALSSGPDGLHSTAIRIELPIVNLFATCC